MKIRSYRRSLLDAVRLAESVAAGRGPKPALQCVHLSAKDNRLMVTATDLEIGLRHRVDAVEVEDPGEAAIPADKLSSILRASDTDEQVTIATDGDATTICGRDSRFKVLGFPPQEFPPVEAFPVAEGGHAVAGSLRIKAGELCKLMDRSQFAAAKELTRYAINGVLWRPLGSRLRLVGTDGKRLAEATGNLDGPAGDKARDGVVPIRVMGLIEKLLVDPESDVEVVIGDKAVNVRCGAVELWGLLVEGQYPKYEEVFPKELDKQLTVGRVEMISAVRRAALMVSSDSKRVIFQCNGGAITLKSSAPEHGDSEVHIPAKFGGGSPFEIALNPDYVVQALQAMDTAEATFEFKSKERPAMLQVGDEFRCCIMPLTIRSSDD